MTLRVYAICCNIFFSLHAHFNVHIHAYVSQSVSFLHFFYSEVSLLYMMHVCIIPWENKRIRR
jgi:hypothetical protein